MRLDRRGLAVVSAATLVIVGALVASVAPAGAAAPAARGQMHPHQHWIGAWEAAPSDDIDLSDAELTDPSSLLGGVDPSGHPKLPLAHQSIRAILTPTYGGSVLRVRLSNRFSDAPVTFGHITIAPVSHRAALARTPTVVTFGGRRTLTMGAHSDVVSDPVRLRIRADRPLAVSMYVSGTDVHATEHYTARQTSYLTLPGAGDHTADRSGMAYLRTDTSRPYVSGIDVRAPRSAHAVLALGDSLTDGYQGMAPLGIPEVRSTVDADGRWTDDLARRFRRVGMRFSVLNAAISGNRLLHGGGTYGPSALSRLGKDVLDQSGVTTVIWMEGINDLGQSPQPTVAQIEASWRKGIRTMHRAGLTVLLGTLMPAGGTGGAWGRQYGSAATNALRVRLNHWIRTKSPADGVVDFDAATRDPEDHSRLNPAFDGGDHLHCNLAGYRAMARAAQHAVTK